MELKVNYKSKRFSLLKLYDRQKINVWIVLKDLDEVNSHYDSFANRKKMSKRDKRLRRARWQGTGA